MVVKKRGKRPVFYIMTINMLNPIYLINLIYINLIYRSGLHLSANLS